MRKHRNNICIIIISGLLYLVNNEFIKVATSRYVQYFFICYFNDILAPLVLLPYCNILLSFTNREFVKLKHILSFILCCGIVWEFITPLIKKSSVCDLYDFVAYFTGAIIYWVIQQKILKNFNNNLKDT